MTLRAGSYDSARPQWRGVIRQEGTPWYICEHKHKGSRDSRACAAAALPALKARDHQDPQAPLPEGWHVFDKRWDVVL
jgi:hypothetical protein